MAESLVVGWDVGGAHLKAAILADGRLSRVIERPCALWQGLDRLAAAGDDVLAELPAAPALHAVTMTGEMADLFPDRASGVAAIAAFMASHLTARRPHDRLRLYAGAKGFIEARAAEREAAAIASANWIATAAWLAARLPAGILVDIGSTTTDIIPFAGGRLTARGDSDAGRLEHGELVYVGVIRTPLMALAPRAPLRGRWRGTMNEHFATSADVFRLLGELDEATDLHPAADNGPKTFEGSARRLLRMVGEDLPQVAPASIVELARWYRGRLLERIGDGLAEVLSHGDAGAEAPLVGVGIGRFLVAELAARFGRQARPAEALLCADAAESPLRAWAIHCAPAVAVARLAAAARP